MAVGLPPSSSTVQTVMSLRDDVLNQANRRHETPNNIGAWFQQIPTMAHDFNYG